LGEFSVDVDGDGAEQPDVLAPGRGDVGEEFVVDEASLVAELLDGQAEVLGGPGADGVGRDGQTPRLFSLVLKVAATDGAFVGVEHVAAQRVDALALVELAGDLAAVVLSGQISGGVDSAAEQPVFLERGGQGRSTLAQPLLTSAVTVLFDLC
jgi:hypothetical protein